MDIRQLRTFAILAETGSLGKAADRLRVAQPALSRQIRLLEEDIGLPLFNRHSRGMQITEAGQELLARVTGLLRQFDQALKEVRELRTAVSGQVAIGMIPSVSSIVGGRLAQRVATELPGVSLRLVDGYARHLMEWLHGDELDAILTYGPGANIHCQAFELLIEEMVLVGPADSELAGWSPMPFENVAHYPLVLPSRPHGLRAVVDEAAAKAGIALNVRLEADTYSVLKEFAISGSGFTILPASSVEREAREGLVGTASLAKPKLTRQLVLASPLGSVETRATRSVLTILKEEICTLIETGRWRAAPMGDLRQLMNARSKCEPVDIVLPVKPVPTLPNPALLNPARRVFAPDESRAGLATRSLQLAAGSVSR
jgi:LysR family nitrogen assimilation transcriptional regulator